MKIEKFEDIKAWQEARVLAKSIFKLTKENSALNRDFRFKDQMTSAAVSVMANIAEGFARRSNKEFIQFLFIAKGSISELQSHLYIALDQGMLSRERFNEMYEQADKVARFVSNFIAYLLNNK